MRKNNILSAKRKQNITATTTLTKKKIPIINLLLQFQIQMVFFSEKSNKIKVEINGLYDSIGTRAYGIPEAYFKESNK